MLTISVRDIKSGLAKVVVEKKTSKDEQGDITTETVKEYTYNGTRKQQKIEIKLSVPYQEYLRGYKVTATDKENNEKTVDENDKKIKCENYIITTAEELQNLATEVNGGKSYEGITIELGNDIDLKEITNFTPIGTSSKTFKGSFNGNGHTISNLQIERNEDRTGLFGYVYTGASIENVRIKNCNITGNGQYVGGIVGYNNGGTISKVAVSGTINNTNVGSSSSGADIGGLVGGNITGTIINCYGAVNIEAKGYKIGGLVGYLGSGTIENCYAIGKVTGVKNYIGGLIGNKSGGTITNSYWTKETSGVEKSSYGKSVLLSALTQEEFYKDKSWDFENIWEIQEGKTTPYLKGMGEQEEIKTVLEGYEIMKGIGTKGNPYQITNEKQLSLISYELGEGIYYELANDINLNSIPNWTPIGTSSSEALKGIFNGNGHTISNMKIVDRSEDYTGLFGYVGTGASIENVRIKDCSITGSGRYVGGIVGYNNGGTISKVAVSGTINNTNVGSSNSGADIGGLVGGNITGTIINCYGAVNIEAKGYKVGGLVGYLGGGTIENCYAIGKVTSVKNYIGGLIGDKSGGTITSSYWDTETSEIAATSSTTKGTGLSTADMKNKDKYIGWDFEKVWKIEEDQYPEFI